MKNKLTLSQVIDKYAFVLSDLERLLESDNLNSFETKVAIKQLWAAIMERRRRAEQEGS